MTNTGVHRPRFSLVDLAAMAVLASACAASPRPRLDGQPRLKDSASETVAAHRGASTGLQLEQEDQRWGIEAARDRRRREADKKRNASAPIHPTAPTREVIAPGPTAPHLSPP